MEGRVLFVRAIKAGLLAGAISVYLCLVGMVTAFSDVHLIEDVVSLGELLLVSPAFVAGYLLVRSRIVDGEQRRPRAPAGLMAGILAGAVTGVVLVVGVLVADRVPEDLLGSVFIHLDRDLLEIVTFGLPLAGGLVLLLGVTTALGGAGAGLHAATKRVRTPIEVGLLSVVIMGMLQDVVRTALDQLGLETSWLFSPRFGGLTWAGAVVSMLVAAGVTFVVGARKMLVARSGARRPRLMSRTRVQWAVTALVLLGLAALPQLLGDFLSVVLGRVGIFMLMGLGLNIVVGYAGLLDLGYVAFFATGAYGMALLTAAPSSGSIVHPGLPFILALPIVIAFTMLVGVVFGGPVLRLRGDYLAIVTLGLGEIARVIVLSDWASPVLGGAPGLLGIATPEISVGPWSAQFGVSDPKAFYYLALLFCVVAAFISWRLSTSRIGRAWVAMREDEQVAEATGVSTVKYKLLAFGLGAAVGGAAGSLFAVQIGSLAPSSFTLLISIQVLAIVILGGMGSIPGVIVGALVLVGLPGFLSEFEEFQLLLYGAALMAIMLLRPQGLVPNVRRSRELQEQDLAQDKWAGDLAADERVAEQITPIGESSG